MFTSFTQMRSISSFVLCPKSSLQASNPPGLSTVVSISLWFPSSSFLFLFHAFTFFIALPRRFFLGLFSKIRSLGGRYRNTAKEKFVEFNFAVIIFVSIDSRELQVGCASLWSLQTMLWHLVVQNAQPAPEVGSRSWSQFLQPTPIWGEMKYHVQL